MNSAYSTTTEVVDVNALRQFLSLLHRDGVFEIRIPKAGRARTVRGYFDDVDAAVQAVQSWGGKVPAIYTTLNPVKADLLARCANRLEPYAENTTTDPDIAHRQWLLIDIDPVRPSGISATAAELEAAKALGRVVYAELASLEWPEPLVAMSGNGVHLLYLIDLPNNDTATALVKAVLVGLAAMYDTAGCRIDQTVFNASRITKLVGTLAAKGDSTAQRPHRLASLLRVPDTFAAVPVDKLAFVASLAPAAPPSAPPQRMRIQGDNRDRSGGQDDFARVNAAALERLSAWVLVLFPEARTYRNGYRVTSKQLGRDLEEDLSFQPEGIQDFGTERGMTPIDVVLAWGGGATPKDALYWLADRVGVVVQRLRSSPPPPPARKPAHGGKTDRDPRPTPSGASAVDTDWQEKLQKNERGQIRNHIGNVMLILSHDAEWQGGVQYCELSYRTMIVAPLPWGGELGEWSDADTARARIWCADKYGFAPTTADVDNAIEVLAQQSARHPVREYLTELVWDGEARLHTWLTDALGAAECPYTAKVGTLWMIAAVARVMQPGCKADCVLILEGKQGTGKSSALSILGGEWFSDTHFALGDKDGYQQMQGVWICELAELDSFNKAESQRAKAFFSSASDRYRVSYGRRAKTYPRQCVFGGTTNQDSYLKDVTGNRRYWPVLCGQLLDVEWLTECRDQLWAEAVQRYQGGEAWWPQQDDLHLFEVEQEARMQVDAWEDLVADYLADPVQKHVDQFSTAALLSALGLETHQMKTPEMTRIGLIMYKLRWPKKRISHEGRRQWVYERPADQRLRKSA